MSDEPHVKLRNYAGLCFGEFYVRQAPETGPGWYIFGRCRRRYGTHPDGSGAYTMIVARPDVKPRRHKHYNCAVRRGWRTKREAVAVAAQMRATYEPPSVPPVSIHTERRVRDLYEVTIGHRAEGSTAREALAILKQYREEKHHG